MTSRGAYAGLCPEARPKTLGARIRAIRVAWKWTQEELAKRLNTEQQQISLYERDKAHPSKATQALLAEFFGIPMAALVEGKGFTIPDLPMPQMPKRSRPGLRVHLPEIDAGTFAAVRVGEFEAQPLSLSECRKLLAKIEKSGGRAWIVSDGP